jgi:hypothetical protein
LPSSGQTRAPGFASVCAPEEQSSAAARARGLNAASYWRWAIRPRSGSPPLTRTSRAAVAQPSWPWSRPPYGVHADR